METSVVGGGESTTGADEGAGDKLGLSDGAKVGKEGADEGDPGKLGATDVVGRPEAGANDGTADNTLGILDG